MSDAQGEDNEVVHDALDLGEGDDFITGDFNVEDEEVIDEEEPPQKEEIELPAPEQQEDTLNVAPVVNQAEVDPATQEPTKITPFEYIQQIREQRRNPEGPTRETMMWDYPLVYDFDFDLENLEKPWVNCSREKREEFFNYGHDEESFRIHQARVQQYQTKYLEKLKSSSVYNDKVLKNQALDHNSINFRLPHELGGAGRPLNQQLYSYFNLFTEDMDLARILPIQTQRQEFYVELPKNKKLDEEHEDQPTYIPYGIDSKFESNFLDSLPPQDRPRKIVEQFEQELKAIFKEREPDLDAEIAELKSILQEEKEKLQKIRRQKRDELENYKSHLDRRGKRRNSRDRYRDSNHYRNDDYRDRKDQGRSQKNHYDDRNDRGRRDERRHRDRQGRPDRGQRSNEKHRKVSPADEKRRSRSKEGRNGKDSFERKRDSKRQRKENSPVDDGHHRSTSKNNGRHRQDNSDRRPNEDRAQEEHPQRDSPREEYKQNTSSKSEARHGNGSSSKAESKPAKSFATTRLPGAATQKISLDDLIAQDKSSKDEPSEKRKTKHHSPSRRRSHTPQKKQRGHSPADRGKGRHGHRDEKQDYRNEKGDRTDRGGRNDRGRNDRFDRSDRRNNYHEDKQSKDGRRDDRHRDQFDRRGGDKGRRPSHSPSRSKQDNGKGGSKQPTKIRQLRDEIK